MSCRICEAIIECSGPGNELDISPSFGFFATQSYSFVVDCPPGYICFDGNPAIVIPPDEIPPISWSGGPMCLQGCLSLICVTPLANATQEDLQNLANFLFFSFAQQQAQCNKIKNSPAPGYPPPQKISGGGGSSGFANPTSIFNRAQTYTAHCVPEDAGTPVTVTIAAHTFGTTLFNPTTDTVAQAQAEMDALALGQATFNANAALACLSGACITGSIVWFAPPTTVMPTAPNTGTLSTIVSGNSVRFIASATFSANAGAALSDERDNLGVQVPFPALGATNPCKLTINVRSMSGFVRIEYYFKTFPGGVGPSQPTPLAPTLGVTVLPFTMGIGTTYLDMFCQIFVGDPGTIASGAIDIEFIFGV